MEKSLLPEELAAISRVPRLNFFNTLPGIKPAVLIGTVDGRNRTNLAIFNSLVHIGSNPPFLGFIMRPLTVPRHTYHNILERGAFTINVVQRDIYTQAHQTSANYEWGTSEFTATGLTPQFTDRLVAPYVQECHIKMGMQFEEEHRIKANGTVLMIGRAVEILLPENAILPSGHINLEEWGTVGVAGLDTYYSLEPLERLTYARASPTGQDK